MKITILGSGASSGSPVIGQAYPPANPKNNRSRASIFIEGAFTKVLVDCTPDLRLQCLQNGIKNLHAAIITHCHADHIHGIDDLKSFAFINKTPVNVYSNKASIDELEERFAYCFDASPSESGWLRPYMKGHIIEPLKPFTIGEFSILALRQVHTKTMDSLGIKIGNFAYTTDVKEFPQESEEHLYGLDLWVVDCLKYEESKTHSNVEHTLKWIEKFKPKRAVLTHLSFNMDYDKLKSQLPSHIEPAFDGMVLECQLQFRVSVSVKLKLTTETKN